MIRGINLRSQDLFGFSDSYLLVEYGKESFKDTANYIPNQSNPLYGKRFHMTGVIPK